MGYTYASQIVHMIFIILFTFIVTISLQNSSHNFIAHSFHGLQKQFYFMEEATVGNEEEREALFVQKFRALLGLNGFKGKSPSFVPICASPAPAPSPFTTAEPPAAAPAPAPVPPKHTKSRSSPPRPIHFAPHHGVQKEHKDRGRVRRALVLTLVSAGVFFVAFLLGFACLCGRIRKQRKKSVKPLWVYGKRGKARGKSKYLSSHSSSSKASLNPSIDVRYLEALAVDLEQQEICFKPNPEILNSASSNEVLKPESDNASSSSTKEIVSVHDGEANSVKYESNGGNSLSSDEDEIIPVDCHSSDNDSFHSCANSHSSNLRLSDASAGSICDITAEVTQNPPTMTLYSPLPSSLYHFAPPPPPPPPPLPPPLPQKLHILPPKSSPVKLKSKDSSSPTLSDSALETNPCVSRRGKQNQAEASALQAFPEKTAKSAEGPSPIPPPPSPPTFLKAKLTSSSTAVKEPPPPPCQLPQYTPLGKNGAPLPKLKPLHWDKVRAAPDRTMVWDKLRSSSFELDEEMIESLFGYNIQGSVKNDEAKSKTPSPTKHVLEPKRLQNMTILLKALNMTAEQACNALMKGNGLGLQQLEALVKLVPTKEEEAKLSEYKGDINELGSAEKFIKALLCIPFAFLRVEAMLYRETFEDEVVHLKNSFSMLEEACKELRSSKLFLKLLEAVLKTGNRMNIGTIRGGARAFKLDALLKLSDVKGTDGKTTLLHFVVQEIIRSEGMRVSDSIMGKINQKNNNRTVEEREEDYRSMGLDLVSGLSSELYHVKKTATLDLDALASSVSNLSDGMTKLHWLVTNKLSGDEKSRSFISSMNSFINYAERNLKELKEDEDRVLLHVREITEYFHGDLSKEEANPLRIFVIVRDFLGMLDHICKELKSLKIPSSPSPLAPFR